MRRVRARARSERIPLSASIALTHGCNLRCVHCYARTSADVRQDMPTAFWLTLLDQLAEAGCLFLLITGGEPFTRADFPEIYRHARECGMVVTVFTNATLVDDAAIALFREMPPRIVDVSVYGMSRETYRRVTGDAGSFDRAWSGVRRLHENGIRVALKTVLMTHTRHEIEAMESAAKELGVKFRLDGAVFPRFDGDREPLALRLPAEEVAKIEFSDPSRAAAWADFYRRFGGHVMKAGDPLYPCSAGMTHAHIGPTGALSPCVMVTPVACSLLDHTFSDAWTWIAHRLAERRIAEESSCIGCEMNILCGYCPGFSALESGSEDRVCGYQCEIGAARLKSLRQAS